LNIVALDLGTITGFALVKDDALYSHGTVSFANSRFEGGGMRYLKFQNWLSDLYALSKSIDILYYEQVRAHKGTDAAHAYGGFLATVTAFCEANNIPYMGVSVQAIKRGLTGKGSVSKYVMVDTVRSLLKLDVDDHNEADALALMYTMFPLAFKSKEY
jgi:crossover junction endodeoxyribonuclease RuvC